MISLSSIVKANLLTNLPQRSMESINAASEIDSAVIEKIDINEVNEKKETIIRQALKKSRHIENEAKLRADALINSAMKSSREIMNTAEKKGYDEGYLRGLVDGATASENAAEEGLTELKHLIELFKSDQKSALGRDEKDLMTIAFELAKKIMKQHLQTDESAVQKMLEEIVMENEGNIKIYMSEYQKTLDIHIDKAIVRKMKGAIKDAKIVMIKEEDLIMSENEGGVVDMSIPVQLEQLKKAVGHAS